MIKDEDYRVEPEDIKYIIIYSGSIDKDKVFKYFPDGLLVQLDYRTKDKYKFVKKLFREDIDKILSYINKPIITMDNDFYVSLIKGSKKSDLNYSEHKYYKDTLVIQSIKPDKDYLYWNKLKLDISIEALNRYLSKKEPVRIYEYGFKYITNPLTSKLSDSYIVIDVETIGLRSESAKLYTIAFTDSKGHTEVYKYNNINKTKVLEILDRYNHYIFHNALFDVKILITNLFMESNEDFIGMFNGLKYFMSKYIDDTMLLVYDKYNNTQGNELGLKLNVLKWTGNYAVDVKDVTQVPLKELMEYNAIDTYATNMLYKEFSDYKPTKAYYYNIKAIPYLLEEMVVGLPVSKERLNEVDNQLNQEYNDIINNINSNKYIKEYIDVLRDKELVKRNNKLKTKQLTIEDINISFNPGSSNQLSGLLYDYLELPILDRTSSNQPATSGDILKTLVNYTEDKDIKELLLSIKSYKDVDKILTGFIEPIKELIFYRPSTKSYWLTGNHKLGGTISGRLASNEPNLANLPSNSKYGKLVKFIFKAPNNWLFAGSDYAALNFGGL